MSNQFDLEQEIMTCWNVTQDLDVLFEELVENKGFDKDKASNFVLGLSTIYEAKFEKLFRTFEGFLKTYYTLANELKHTQQELNALRDEMETIEEANREAAEVANEGKTLQQLFDEQEEENLLSLAEEQELQLYDDLEDEFGFR